MSIEETLEDRGQIYGDHIKQHQLRTRIMQLIHDRFKEHNGEDMPLDYFLMIYDYVNKISRLAVSPTHEDSHHDIGGYAVLNERYVKNANKQ